MLIVRKALHLTLTIFEYFYGKKITLQFLQQINVKKCPSSLRCWDSNSHPLESESPPITTRPGLLFRKFPAENYAKNA